VEKNIFRLEETGGNEAQNSI